MMKIKINLLSPQKQDRLQNLVKFIFSKYILEIVIFFTAIIAIMMIWSWLTLQESFTQLAVSSASVNKEYFSYNQDIRQINLIIENINKSSSQYQPTTPYIKEIMKNLPINIKLKTIFIDKKNKTVELTGTAKTRQDLLDYQEKLKEINWIDSVTAPTSKLFQKENVSFEFKTNLKNAVKIK
jgi:nitrogen fixation protein FixH